MQLDLMDGYLTADGFFKGRAIVSGEGVNDYTDILGYRAYRSAAEVFKPESMATLQGIPITHGHPHRLLNSSDAEHYTVGFTGDNVWREGNKLGVNITLTQKWLIERVIAMLNSGLPVRFSVGQRALPVESSGEYEGVSYTVELVNIVYNHLAMLLDGDPTPRYNKSELLTDSTGDQHVFVTDSAVFLAEKTQEGYSTVKITLPNGQVIDVNDSEASRLQDHLKDHEKLTQDFAKVSGQLDQSNRDLSTARESLMDSTKVSQVVQDRLTLAAEARVLMDSTKSLPELAAMDPTELREAVLVANGTPQETLTAKKTQFKDSYDVYLDGAYESLKSNKGVDVSDSILKNAQSNSDAARAQDDKQSDDSEAVVLQDAHTLIAERKKNNNQGAASC